MKISTKGRYALRMLLDLAAHQTDGYIALKEITNTKTGIVHKVSAAVPFFYSCGNFLFIFHYFYAILKIKLLIGGEIMNLSNGNRFFVNICQKLLFCSSRICFSLKKMDYRIS